MKLDETYEIKNSEEQSALIDSFVSSEENKILDDAKVHETSSVDIPSGLSIENASYMEKNSDINIQETQLDNPNITIDKTQEEHTPKLFSDENNHADDQSDDYKEEEVSERLFDQDVNEEEDFEIPAFLRRQKF